MKAAVHQAINGALQVTRDPYGGEGEGWVSALAFCSQPFNPLKLCC